MTLTRLLPKKPSPSWEIAELYPVQGDWDESDYLGLTDSTNRLVELSDGYLEVLPMPKTSHQRMVQYLHGLLLAFVTAHKLGTVLFAPLRVRLWKKTFREPDLVFMLARHSKRVGEDFWDGADLVIEVVSSHAKDREHDLVKKRREYARAGISEYWIVDPKQERILVLKLRGKRYVVHTDASSGELAKSTLLPGFEVEVQDVMAAAAPSAG